MTSAILESALQAVALRSKVNFGLWEDTLIKGNFYPALWGLGRRVGDSDLPKRLAKLSIILKDYNDRQETGNLADDIIARLTDELTNLIEILDNRGPAKGFCAMASDKGEFMRLENPYTFGVPSAHPPCLLRSTALSPELIMGHVWQRSPQGLRRLTAILAATEDYGDTFGQGAVR